MCAAQKPVENIPQQKPCDRVDDYTEPQRSQCTTLHQHCHISKDNFTRHHDKKQCIMIKLQLSSLSCSSWLVFVYIQYRYFLTSVAPSCGLGAL